MSEIIHDPDLCECYDCQRAKAVIGIGIKSAEIVSKSKDEQIAALQSQLTRLEAENQKLKNQKEYVYKKEIKRLKLEIERFGKVKQLITKHTEAKLKTINTALANSIHEEKIIKMRGECMMILQALEEQKK